MRFLVILFILLFNISNSQEDINQKNYSLEPNELDLNKYMLKSPEGQEFWICYMRNHNDPDKVTDNTKLHLELFITSDKDANVIIEIKALKFKEKVFVPANTVRNVKISTEAQITSSEIIEEGMGVYIKSDTPVTVYGLNRRRLTTDTFLALPTNVIGTAYMAVCYNISVQLTSQFAIVATEDDTKVTILPTVETAQGRQGGKEFEVVLNKGDVYQVTAKNKPNDPLKNDLTGTLVTSDKKFSFFSGHQCAYIPDNVMACNHLIEQVPPISSWGKHFYIGEQKKRSRYNYRVVASQDSTIVFVNNELEATINAGQFIENNVKGEVQVTANKPVLVSQYSQGFRNGDEIGDPMMLLVSPTQQFLKKYRFATPVNGFWEHYVNVVVPTNSINSLKLNGKTIPKNVFKQFGQTRYSIAYLRVNYGTHQLEADQPFGMTPYGFGYDKDKYDAYGNLGGQSFIEFIEYKDTLPPDANINGSQVIIRDDRVSDEGIERIVVKSSQNIIYNIPDFVEGVPQVSIKLKADLQGEIGKLVLNTFDLAGNSKLYTICYTLNENSTQYQFYVNQGDVDCEKFEKTSLQFFGRISQLNNYIEINNLANIESLGEFNSKNSTTGILGAGMSFAIKPNLFFTSRITLSQINSMMESPDSVSSKLLLDNGEFIDFQEATQMKFDIYNFILQLNLEYQFNARFYSFFGLNASFLSNRQTTINRKINYPNFVNYPETLTKQGPESIVEIEELNNLNFGFNIGLGINQKINNKFVAFSELEYLYNFSNLLQNDNRWNYNLYSLNLGIKYILY